MFSHISRVAAARSLADDIYANKRQNTSNLERVSFPTGLADRFTRKR